MTSLLLRSVTLLKLCQTILVILKYAEVAVTIPVVVVGRVAGT